MGDVRIGTCGFCVRQRRYYRTFRVIELQKPFYQPPLPATAERWRAEAPEDFEFTLKAFQAITHPPASPTYRRSKLSDSQQRQCGGFRDTAVVRDAWRTTLRLARTLEAKLVVFQCPASFRPTDEAISNMRRFFARAERCGLRLGWEPRGARWTDPIVRELCRELDLIHVANPFDRRPVRGAPRYFRLHGIGGYKHRYSDAELRQLKRLCTARLTYCMFNNISMKEDAERFMALCGDRRR